MAVLTPVQLAILRQQFIQDLGNVSVDFVKATVNNAFQALEDWYEGEKSNVSSLINTATSPYIFTADEKRFMAAYFLLQKAAREREET